MFKFKQKITGQRGNDGTKDIEIIRSLKHLSNIWRTLEIAQINCEIYVILTWSANVFIVAGTVTNQIPTFAITDAKLYVSVVTLST